MLGTVTITLRDVISVDACEKPTEGLVRLLRERGLFPPYEELPTPRDSDCRIVRGVVNPCFSDDPEWP